MDTGYRDRSILNISSIYCTTEYVGIHFDLKTIKKTDLSNP